MLAPILDGTEKSGRSEIHPVSNTEFPLEVFTDNEYGRLTKETLNDVGLQGYSDITKLLFTTKT